MRMLAIGIALATLTSCAAGSQVAQVEAPATSDPEQVIACVTDELERLGYQVTELQPQEGQVDAARVDEPEWPLQLLGFRSTADRISVFVGPDELQVTALAADDVPEPGAPGTGTLSASQQEAERVITACAD